VGGEEFRVLVLCSLAARRSQPMRHDELSIEDRADGVHELGDRRVLGQIPSEPDSERLFGNASLLKSGQREDLRFRPLLEDPPAGKQPVLVGKSDIHQDQVRTLPQHTRHRVFSGP